MKNVISHVIGILELVLLTKLPLAQSSLARLGFDVLRNAKDSYAASIQSRIENERLGSREFWKITNKVLNRGKTSVVPTVINGPELLSSASDKAKLFATNIAANSTLDDVGHPLPSFPARTTNLLSEFSSQGLRCHHIIILPYCHTVAMPLLYTPLTLSPLLHLTSLLT